MIYCNSHFLSIREWLKKTEDLPIDHPLNEFRVDILFTRFMLFNSLLKNLPRMFPDYVLDARVHIDHEESYIVIKRTTEEALAASKAQKERERDYAALKQFLET